LNFRVIPINVRLSQKTWQGIGTPQNVYALAMQYYDDRYLARSIQLENRNDAQQQHMGYLCINHCASHSFEIQLVLSIRL
jgi:hypothetical protein